MAAEIAAVGVAAPYQNAEQEIVDSVLWQVYYRTLGAVGIHIGVRDSFAAARWLAANGRGGAVTWVVPDRVFVWFGITVAPGLSGSPTMGALFAGSGLANLDTGIVRVGFWAPILWDRLVAGAGRVFGG